MSKKAEVTEVVKGLPIKEAAEYLDREPQYVRTLIRQGKLHPEKVYIGDSDTLWRYEIPLTELDAYKTQGRHSGRPDGRIKWVVYATPAEAEAAQAVFAQAGLTITLEKAYDPIVGRKQYEKQKAKRLSAKRAAVSDLAGDLTS